MCCVRPACPPKRRAPEARGPGPLVGPPAHRPGRVCRPPFRRAQAPQASPGAQRTASAPARVGAGQQSWWGRRGRLTTPRPPCCLPGTGRGARRCPAGPACEEEEEERSVRGGSAATRKGAWPEKPCRRPTGAEVREERPHPPGKTLPGPALGRRLCVRPGHGQAERDTRTQASVSTARGGLV